MKIIAFNETEPSYQNLPFLCGISAHFVRINDISLFIYLFIYLFICIREREPSVCHMVSIRKREDPGNECLSVAAITRLISTCFLGAINLQGKEKSSSLLSFFYCI